jgi:4-amino-4-deoxy-L-arabinose transferase-like glycosyltransferase
METASQLAPQSTIRCWREWEFWVLAALTALIYFSRIADLPIRGEETRRAMVAAEILRSGDWIVPHQQGAPFLSRPPVASWPIVWAAWGVGDLSLIAVRLPTILATLLTTLLVYGYSRQFLNRLGALSSGLIYATSAQVLQLGRVAETEATFTLFLGGALMVWHWGYSRRWAALATWTTAYTLLAIATLTKSLQAPIYFVGAVAVFLWWTRDFRFLLSSAHVVGCVVFAAIFLAWQVPFYEQLDWPAVRQVWASDVGLRFASLSPISVVTHWIGFPWKILACLLPWSLLLPAYLWPKFRQSIGRATPMVTYLLIAWLVALPTCWLVPNARPRYLMPLYPLAAPLIGLVVQSVFSSEAIATVRRGWKWFVASLAILSIGAAAVVSTANWICGVSSSAFSQPPWFAALFLLAATGAAAILLQFWNRWSSRAASISMLTLAGLLGLTASGLIVNAQIAVDPHSDQQIAQLRERLPRGIELISFGRVGTMFSYHWREPIQLVDLKLREVPEDFPKEHEYFCFSWSRPTSPRLPFPWRVEATIDCDRVADDTPENRVIVGRRLDAIAQLPDETLLRR